MSAKNSALSLRVLARLLSYPDAQMRGHLPAMRDALRRERAVGTARLAELEALMDGLALADPLDAEADYVHLFDRGPAMIDLAQTYDQAGLHLAPDELPDYLPAVLEFASTLLPREARAFLGEMAHIFNALFGALQQRQSGYASVIGALLELAGEKAEPVAPAPDEPLDASWAEPPAFDGCSAKGQARPGEAQPIRIVRKDVSGATL